MKGEWKGELNQRGNVWHILKIHAKQGVWLTVRPGDPWPHSLMKQGDLWVASQPNPWEGFKWLAAEIEGSPPPRLCSDSLGWRFLCVLCPKIWNHFQASHCNCWTLGTDEAGEAESVLSFTVDQKRALAWHLPEEHQNVDTPDTWPSWNSVCWRSCYFWLLGSSQGSLMSSRENDLSLVKNVFTWKLV